ncbi:MAG: signal peptidase II [Syntrophaceae bacterium]|nr:signal peptidase II [Syntrophaceae bacterium]
MKRKYWILLIFSIGILILDQWTKYVVVEKLALYQKVEVIEGFFSIIHVRNTGGAFGIFGGEKGGSGSLLFIFVSLTAIGAITFLFIKIKDHERLLALSLSLILSGAIGNLIDRFRYGEVIDFLQFYLPFLPWRIFNPWPTFNIADSVICIGIGLLVLELLKQERKKLKSPG